MPKPTEPEMSFTNIDALNLKNVLADVQSPKGQTSAELPETIEINGVTYRREGDFVDKQVNQIKEYQAIAHRTGITLRQAVWFNSRDGILPG